MKRTATATITALSFVALWGLSAVRPGGRGVGTSLVPGAQAQTQIQNEDDSAKVDKSHRRRCSNRTLRGDFGFTAEGTTTAASPVPPPLQGPFASSGLANFDGEGNFTLTATSSFNGVLQGPVTVRGTYSVREDCTYTSAAENGATFSSVIVKGGKEILIIQTTPGVAITGTAKKL